MRSFIVIICFLFLSATSYAAVITPDNFEGNQIVQTYEDVGLEPNSNFFTTTTFGDDTYIASNSSSTLVYSNTNCMSGFCIRTIGGSQVVRIILGGETNRAGVYISTSVSPLNHATTYYGASGDVLGVDNVGTEIYPGYMFFGFESLDASITSVRLQLRGAISSPVYFDNFTTETVVPIPSAVWLFGSGLIGLIGFARRRK